MRSPLPAAVGEWSLTPVPAGLWASARTSAAPADVRGLPAEPGRLGVVIDAEGPDAGTDRLLAGLLPALASPGPGGGLRLVLSSAADRYGRTAARRFGLDVITAEDQVTITPYGHALVRPASWFSDPMGGRAPDPGFLPASGGSPGSGTLPQWRRWLPDGECGPAGVLYPSPAWEAPLRAGLPADLARPATAHRVPAGLALALPGQSDGFARTAYAVWPDPERLTIVVSPSGPPAALLDGLARLLLSLPLDGTDGVRLYWPRAAADSTGQAVRQLARRCGTDLIAPAADLSDSGGFGAVSHGPLGAAPWLRFSRDGDMQLLGSLYPVPGWESALADVDLPADAGGVAFEHVAAGISLYRPGPGDAGLAATARSLLPDPHRITIVVSGGLSPDESADLLAGLLGQVPPDAAGDVRLVMARAGAGGAGSLAQSLADVSGSRLLAPVGQWTATPGGRLRIVRPASYPPGAVTDGWASFTPRPRTALQEQAAPPPTDTAVGAGAHSALPAEAPAAPGIAALADTAVADSGPAMGAKSAEGTRIQVPDGPEGTPDPAAAAELQAVVPTQETRPRGKQVQAAEDAPPVLGPLPAAAGGQATADSGEPDATSAAFALLPRAHRSTAEERQAYRDSTPKYQSHAVMVRRMVTQRPGLRLSTADAEDALVTDFAAVLDFLEAGPAALHQALREAGSTARHPWAACVVSGLRRLPSFTGPVFTTAIRNGRVFRGYEVGQLIIEPAFVFATSAPQLILEGEVEYVIWSETAKRISALAPDGGADEVIFAAGTAFRVLHAEPGADASGPPRFFLREVAKHDQDQFDPRDVALLERLAAVAALRDGLAAEDRVAPRRRVGRPGPPLGVDRHGLPFVPDADA